MGGPPLIYYSSDNGSYDVVEASRTATPPGMDSGALSAQANDHAASTYPHKRTTVTYPRSIRKPT